MNTKEFLSQENFLKLFETLVSLGFQLRKKEDIIETVRNMEFTKFIKHREGIETVYELFLNGKWIIVLTTFSQAIGGAKVHDKAWVLIIDPRNKHPFFSFPIRRSTKNFFNIMLSWTATFIDIVTKWPKTATGEDRLLILVRGTMHRGQFVHPDSAVRHLKHNRPIFATDLELEPANKKFFKGYFDRYDRRRASEAKKGIHRIPQRVLTSERNNQHVVVQPPEKGVHYETVYDGEHLE